MIEFVTSEKADLLASWASLKAVVESLDDFSTGFCDFHLSIPTLIDEKFKRNGKTSIVRDSFVTAKAEFLSILIIEVKEELEELLEATAGCMTEED